MFNKFAILVLVLSTGCMEGLPAGEPDATVPPGVDAMVLPPDATTPTADATTPAPDATVPLAPVLSFTATPPTIVSGASSTLNWTSTNTTSCSVNGVGDLATSGMVVVNPTTTTTFGAICVGPGGFETKWVTVTVTPAPPLDPMLSFTATPPTIVSGSSSELSWTSTNTTGCAVNGVGGLATNGTMVVTPATTTMYDATCVGPGGFVTHSVTVTVTATPPLTPIINSFTATPPTIVSGSSSTLNWTSTNTTGCSVNGVGGLPANGTVVVNPATTTTFEATCVGPGGFVTQWVTVTVTAAPPPAPIINSFTATPPTIVSGLSSTLSWTSNNTTSCSVNGIGGLPTNGTVVVTPATTTVFNATCTGLGGNVTQSVTVTVTPAPACVVNSDCSDGLSWTTDTCSAGTCVYPIGHCFGIGVHTNPSVATIGFWAGFGTGEPATSLGVFTPTALTVISTYPDGSVLYAAPANACSGKCYNAAGGEVGCGSTSEWIGGPGGHYGHTEYACNLTFTWDTLNLDHCP